MSTITLPSQFQVTSFVMTQNVVQRVSAAPFGGSEQAIDLLNDRWTCSCEVQQKNYADASYIEGFIAAMRGQTNVVALYHLARPAPNGTVRGSLTLSATAAQGAQSIVVTGCSPANGTLLTGDLLGVGGLLLMVASDCVASGGVITVPITNVLRSTQSAGAVVTWNKPTATFRLLASSGVKYVAMQSDVASFDFGEKI